MPECSPQPLKAGIIATAAFRRFLEFSMYSQRCISAGSVVACSACDLIRPAASPYLSPCTLAKPKVPRKQGFEQLLSHHVLVCLINRYIHPGCQDTLGCAQGGHVAHSNKADWLRGVLVSACGGGVTSLKRGHMLGTVPAMRNKIPKITLRISDKTCPGRQDTQDRRSRV